MSVRRLADEAIQPQAFAFNRENAAWAKATIKKYPAGRQQSAVIPLLMRAQDQEGWVSRPAIEAVADMLDMPYIRVLEVATFYTQFQLKPVGTKAHIQVCGTTPCMLRGAEELRAVCQHKIHHDPHTTNEAGTLSWEEVECLGACVNAPMVAIGHDTYEDLTADRLGEVIDAFEAGEGDTIPTGPQNGRTFAMPVTGATTLTTLDFSAKASKPATAKSPASRAKAEKAAAAGAKAAAPRSGAKPKAASKTGADKPLFKAPKGKADDLKMISGVGPKLEKELNDLGITRFEQVAKFTPDDIERVDQRLTFKGRITRDDWIAQADALASGGVDEYVKRFGKKPR